MADYFSEYTSFIGAKSLPSPADTPYETPGYIRSKRNSRVGSMRENSTSPPPLPPDTFDPNKSRDQFSAIDPKRFTPTLHASLVSEILSLKREVEAKNALVENLETSLAASKTENEALVEQNAAQAKDVRRAKHHVEQMEKGTYEAVAGLVQERDDARATVEELRGKLEKTQKQTRRQDNDAVKTQEIWEREKESWDNERRQLERRIHVTESRLRAFVDEMSAQQAATQTHQVRIEEPDDKTFKDSGVASESDSASVQLSPSPSKTPKHKRNMSSVSFRSVQTSVSSRSLRRSGSNNRTGAATPDLHTKSNGFSLADELGIDEEDDYDVDEFEHADDELDDHERARRTMESRQSTQGADPEHKAKRVLGLPLDVASPATAELQKDSLDQKTWLPAVPETTTPVPQVEYVDRGYQPSPPPGSPRAVATNGILTTPTIIEPESEAEAGAENAQISTGHASDAQTETLQHESAKVMPEMPAGPSASLQEQVPSTTSPKISYTSTSTQTEIQDLGRPKSLQSNRDSLQLPPLVPSIAIHPPSSRPSSPRPYVLPPGTKNASTQANLSHNATRHASVQTEEIRVDKRPVKLPPHLLPAYLLPSPSFESAPALQDKGKKRASNGGGTAKIFTKVAQAPQLPSPQMQSPIDSSPEFARVATGTDVRSRGLRAIPLPRPILAPAPTGSAALPPGKTDGPLNRASQYGVSGPARGGTHLAGINNDDSDDSDFGGPAGDRDAKDIAGSLLSLSRPPQGRFGLSEPPKVVPEDKEISPERRPVSSESAHAAPAPSISSSRANSRVTTKPPTKLGMYRNLHSRSPSFTSMASSITSSTAPAPPYPIPTRSSSRVLPHSYSEGSVSPSPFPSDPFAPGPSTSRVTRNQSREKPNLRKVQSAAVIRQQTRRTSPQKGRRRRRRASPELTPVHSMATESPAPTKFPIPELPTPLIKGASHDYIGSMSSKAPGTASSSIAPDLSPEMTLVDAIAATMVGEWMLKYIRKRKSFSIGDTSPDYAKAAGQDGLVDITGTGVRHKRWVWLSPYERTIMWDTKQPSSGAALLGKKGRKLPIQSVMDVQDNTPLPKGSELKAAFNRSILILTPQRALKFTAVSQERHNLWMTALTFLARTSPSNELPPMPIMPPMPMMPPMPAIPVGEQSPMKRTQGPSFGRASIRDSVRLAKGERPQFPRPLPKSEDGATTLNLNTLISDTGAEFPAVPRLYSNTTRHQRKRSNTSPRLPPPLSNIRSFSSSAALPSSSAGLAPGSTGTTFRPSLFTGATSLSPSGSRADSAQSPQQANFFEAVQGTVRMEAFVDPSVRDGVVYVPAPPPPAANSRRRQRGDSHTSIGTTDKRRAGYVFDENGLDPFKGF